MKQAYVPGIKALHLGAGQSSVSAEMRAHAHRLWLKRAGWFTAAPARLYIGPDGTDTGPQWRDVE